MRIKTGFLCNSVDVRYSKVKQLQQIAILQQCRGRSHFFSSPIWNSRSVLTPLCGAKLPCLFVQMVNLSPGLQDLLCSQQTALLPLYYLRNSHFLLAGISNLVLKDNMSTNSFSNLTLVTTSQDCQCICLITLLWSSGVEGILFFWFFLTNPVRGRTSYPLHTVECFALFNQVWKGEKLMLMVSNTTIAWTSYLEYRFLPYIYLTPFERKETKKHFKGLNTV